MTMGVGKRVRGLELEPYIQPGAITWPPVCCVTISANYISRS